MIHRAVQEQIFELVICLLNNYVINCIYFYEIHKGIDHRGALRVIPPPSHASQL